MRKFWLATTAAALVLGLGGRAIAQGDQNSGNASSVAPPAATSSEGLMFSKEAPAAKPIVPDTVEPLQAAPAQSMSSPSQATEQEVAPLPSEQKAAASLPAEDAAVAELKNLVESKLSQYVSRSQDRAGVLAFYRGRDFAPIWVASGKATPRAKQAMDFLRGVDADGLEPADYPTPRFADADPAKLAADELALTNSLLTFARHASIGRVAFSRVSGAVYYDQKAPDAADVLGASCRSTDVRATLDAFNPQSPQYKALKAELAAVRNGKSAEPRQGRGPSAEPKATAKHGGKTHHGDRRSRHRRTRKVDSIIANMERWRWMPHDLGPTYVMVNIPDYTLKVVQDGKTVWQTKIVVGKPGSHATPLLTETMKYITVNPTWNVPPSIIRNEYLPALAQDPNALARVGPEDQPQPATARSASISRRASATRSAASASTSRTASWSTSTTRRTSTCSPTTRAPTATAACGCRTRMNMPRCCSAITQPEDHYTAARIRSMYGTTERTINLKTADPGLHHLSDRVRRRRGQAADPRRHLRARPRHHSASCTASAATSDVPIARNYNSSSKPVASASAPAPARRGFGYHREPELYDVRLGPGRTRHGICAAPISRPTATRSTNLRSRHALYSAFP